MTEQQNEIVKRPISAGNTGLQLRTIEDMYRFAQCAVKAGLTPEGFKTPEQVIIAVQTGAELGLPPMRALQSICVVKGRPTLWGDVALGLVNNSGKRESFSEYFTIKGKKMSDAEIQYDKIDSYPADLIAVCETKAIGDSEITLRTFSVADAKLAGLWKKAGTWTTHPKRMLKYKARAFALRDCFPDILQGMHLTEEMQGEEPLPMAQSTVLPRDERRRTVVSTEATTPAPDKEGSKEADGTGTAITDAVGVSYDEVKALFTCAGGKDFAKFAAFVLCYEDDEVDSPEKFTPEMLASIKSHIAKESVEGF